MRSQEELSDAIDDAVLTVEVMNLYPAGYTDRDWRTMHYLLLDLEAQMRYYEKL